jgi:hypothetical protein
MTEKIPYSHVALPNDVFFEMLRYLESRPLKDKVASKVLEAITEKALGINNLRPSQTGGSSEKKEE